MDLFDYFSIIYDWLSTDIIDYSSYLYGLKISQNDIIQTKSKYEYYYAILSGIHIYIYIDNSFYLENIWMVADIYRFSDTVSLLIKVLHDMNKIFYDVL